MEATPPLESETIAVAVEVELETAVSAVANGVAIAAGKLPVMVDGVATANAEEVGAVNVGVAVAAGVATASGVGAG